MIPLIHERMILLVQRGIRWSPEKWSLTTWKHPIPFWKMFIQIRINHPFSKKCTVMINPLPEMIFLMKITLPE